MARFIIYGRRTEENPLPLKEPKLMTSFTSESQFPFEEVVGDRVEEFGSDWSQKMEKQEPDIHPDAYWTWKKGVVK